MASSLALKRLLSSTRSLLRPPSSSTVSNINRPPLYHSSSSPPGGVFDPLWRRSLLGQLNEYSSVAAGVGGGKVEDDVSNAKKKNVLRPLSPHLPIYKPQLSSTSSILNRFSGVYLSGYALAFYLVSMKMGSVCFSYEGFYHFFFYSSKLTLLSSEIAALALVYHVYAGIRHLLMDASGTVFPSKS